MRSSILVLFFSITCIAQSELSAQHIFSEKFKGCTTDQFALERDTCTANLNTVDFIEELRVHLGQRTLDEIEGKLQLQIIVDPEGHSCLLSLENETNMKTRTLKLKSWIDSYVVWITEKKVAALVVLEFNEHGIGFRRMGMDGKKGWHFLECPLTLFDDSGK